ncbi:NADH:flavin oxidoreductase/NADH oxidase [Microbacterium trichothecenolyticum]|uniref:NADH:flavin oxidoreductase/NADH oxidase n=1 Tax=Microbacterium trichothecenolyticum TaxID=69370 RepID=UPI001C6E372C|nr:NADH:flavin oxidoreductase/NADH oxidase [Microbacterium trichothecenolyticum]MBW9121927.1 NADH:flavin oxidoreductase/NADH oxidase [Microbacterium trichothecenolyticum]
MTNLTIERTVPTPQAGAVDETSLFQPLRLRGLETSNRLWLSPMCQYSATDGLAGDWHLAHLGDRASGGWGLLFTEATAVSAEGRISDGDTGIWNAAQALAWRRVVDFVHDRGTPIALQLAHAGRKASLGAPWSGIEGSVPAARGGWVGHSVSDEPAPGLAAPVALDSKGISRVVDEFAEAAARGVFAGFDAIELLAGHGFLLHSFLSPLTNHREDAYGATGRGRLLEEIVVAVRGTIPARVPLLVRVSATDWLPGGLTVADTVALVSRLAELGVDLVDVSSGGLLPAEIPVAPGYQVDAATEIRARTGVSTGAVGLITDSVEADRIVRSGRADAVLIGRAALRDPYFALRAAHELGKPATWQPQYARGAWGV